MGGKSGNLVAHAFRGSDGNFVNETFVGVKVESETGVILLDDGPCGLFDGFGSYSLLYISRIKEKNSVGAVRCMNEGKARYNLTAEGEVIALCTCHDWRRALFG